MDSTIIRATCTAWCPYLRSSTVYVFSIIKDYNFFKEEVNMKVRSGIFRHPANRNKA